jgi:hypothetical protein
MATTALLVPVIESPTGRHLALTGRFWGATVLAGVVGGIAMGVLLVCVSAASGGMATAPLRMVAATFPMFRASIHPAVEASPYLALGAGMALHLAVAIIWAILFTLSCAAVPRALSHYNRSLWLGAILGFVAWIVTGMWIGPAVDPTLSNEPTATGLAAHLVYGLLCAACFTALIRGRPRVMPREAPPPRPDLRIAPRHQPPEEPRSPAPPPLT